MSRFFNCCGVTLALLLWSYVSTNGNSVLSAESVTQPQQSLGGSDGWRLASLYQRGEDGSAVQLPMFFDSWMGWRCAYARSIDGAYRCLPLKEITADASGYYADPNCNLPLGQWSGCSAEPPVAVEFTEYSGCGETRTHVFHLGQTTTPTHIYQNGNCEPVDQFPDGIYYETGPEWTPSLFVSMTIEH